MSARALVTAAVVALGTLAVLVVGEPGPVPRSSPPPQSEARRPSSPPAADFDLAAIRDVFRFADEHAPATRGPATPPERPSAEPEAGPGSFSGPRLVGLVRRDHGLLAALAVEGEVVLLEPGASSLGYTVIDVSEEKVVIRDPEGAESVLPLLAPR